MKIKVFLTIFIAVLTLVRAETDWTTMTLKVSGGTPLEAANLLKSELYKLVYDDANTVGNYMNLHFDREYRLDNLLAEYRIMNQQYLTDGNIQYVLQLPLLPKLIGLLLPDQKPVKLVVPMLCPVCRQEWPKDLAVPEGVQLVPKEIETVEYTGVVIDCRNLKFTPSLFPKIQSDQGQEVYSINFCDPGMVVENGLVLYTASEPFNEIRIGYNPLRIQALGVTGANQTDIRISSYDARRMHGSKQNLNLLKECRIAIIISP
jgi:hypothetical protein